MALGGARRSSASRWAPASLAARKWVGGVGRQRLHPETRRSDGGVSRDRNRVRWKMRATRSMARNIPAGLSALSDDPRKR